MKKFSAILFVLAALPMMAADLEFVVNASSPGFVDAKTIDVAAVPEGEEIIVEVWLRNIDFTLAGFEGEIQFPTWLTLVDTATPGVTYTTGLTAQRLPADATGASTATTFRNAEGYARVGGVITGVRPTSGDSLLATLLLKLGRDYDSGGNPRIPAQATCASATEELKFLACTTGAANCHIIANDSATAEVVNYAPEDLLIALIDSSTTVVKGDANQSNTLTNQDVSKALQCIFFGDNLINANCPLLSSNTDDWLRRLDVNCSGSATNADIGPLLRRALGTNNRPANKTLDFNAVNGEGNLQLAGGDAAAYMVGVTLQAQGKVRFGTPVLSDEGIEDGWQVAGKQLSDANTYNYILYHTSNEDLPVPALSLPYVAQGDARVAVASSETVNLKGNTVHEPTVSRMELRQD